MQTAESWSNLGPPAAASRAVYTVKFVEAVFVLHCSQKKSKTGIATPKADMDIIRARLKVAEAMAQELRDAKTDH
jgi:phage-related protein